MKPSIKESFNVMKKLMLKWRGEERNGGKKRINITEARFVESKGEIKVAEELVCDLISVSVRVEIAWRELLYFCCVRKWRKCVLCERIRIFSRAEEKGLTPLVVLLKIHARLLDGCITLADCRQFCNDGFNDFSFNSQKQQKSFFTLSSQVTLTRSNCLYGIIKVDVGGKWLSPVIDPLLKRTNKWRRILVIRVQRRTLWWPN